MEAGVLVSWASIMTSAYNTVVGENPQFLFKIIQLDDVSLGFSCKGWCPEPIFGKPKIMKFFSSNIPSIPLNHCFSLFLSKFPETSFLYLIHMCTLKKSETRYLYV